MKKTMWLFSTLAFLFLGNIANAETDLLNLGSYTDGTKVPYGENMIVVQEAGKKWITAVGGTKGRLNIPINLYSDSFEILLEIDSGSGFIENGTTDGFFLIADEIRFKFNLNNTNYGDTVVEDSRKRASVWQDDAKNTVRFAIKDGIAKVYANDVFVQKVTINEKKQGVTYTNLMVTNVSDNYVLYSLKINDSDNITTPRPTSPAEIPSNISLAEEFEKGKQEGIQQCVDNPSSCGITVSDSSISCPTTNSGDGIQLPTIAPNLNLHIPTIEYQSLGGKMNLWVDLQFTTTDDGKMWWILDDYGVNP